MAPLLIVGFHRSGTSAVARMFHDAGVHLGDELLGADPANPYGHFEDVAVVAMHDRWLADAGLTWKSTTTPPPLPESAIAELSGFVTARQAAASLWGVKDPRICLFLDSWIDVCPEARVVVVVRRPGDAIASLHMRHSRRHVDLRGIDPSDLDFWRDPDLGLKLWLYYHEELLASLHRAPDALVVNFDNRAGLARLPTSAAQRWDLALDTSRVTEPDERLGRRADRIIEVRSAELLARATDVWAELTNHLNVT